MTFCGGQSSASKSNTMIMKMLLLEAIVLVFHVSHVAAVGVFPNNGDRSSGLLGDFDPEFLERVRNSFRGVGDTPGSDNLPFQEPPVMDKNGGLSFPFSDDHWTPWSSCIGSVQTRHRSRGCYGSQCTQSKVCQSMYIKNEESLEWGEWSGWSGCVTVNGNTQHIRQRQCKNPSHPDCRGVDYDTKACGSQTDNGLSSWGSWSECDVRGQQFRHRECQGWNCRHVKLSENQSCSTGYGGGSWSVWTSWSRCNNNYRYRDRVCHGSHCVGSNSESQPCSDRGREVYAEWSGWESWSSCQRGSQSRSRQCLGNGCIGSPRETRKCGYTHGDDSLWSSWNEWAGCDSGNQLRYRTCQGSSRCLGRAYEVRRCSGPLTIQCSGSWGPWSPCTGLRQFRHQECPSPGTKCRNIITESRSCFGSTSTFNRRRSCQDSDSWGQQRRVAPSWGWDVFSGLYNSQSLSNKSRESRDPTSRESWSETSVVATWAEWSSWTSCDQGYRRRKRECLKSSCTGPAEETRTCYVRFVPGKGPGSIEIPYGKG